MKYYFFIVAKNAILSLIRPIVTKKTFEKIFFCHIMFTKRCFLLKQYYILAVRG